jgi:hypothetical protein
MVEEMQVGIDQLRSVIDRLPVSIPTATKEMSDNLLVPFFASRMSKMIIPYADAAAFMLLQPVSLS